MPRAALPLLLGAGLLAGCALSGPPVVGAAVEVVDGVVLPGWPRAVERHIARACNPGPGPSGGVLMDVAVDPFGYVRVAGPAAPREGGPYSGQVALALLTSNCGHFSAPETPVRALIRVYPR